MIVGSVFGSPPKNEIRPLRAAIAIACSWVVHYRQLHIHGADGSAPDHNKRALEYISTGQVPVKDLITKHIPLERRDVRVRHRRQGGEAIKVTVDPLREGGTASSTTASLAKDRVCGCP